MNKYKNLFKVLYMNIVLTFHLSQCLALASLLPQIAEQNHYSSLGELGLITIYTINLLFNILAPFYLTKWRYRFGFFFQAILVLPCFISAYFVAGCDGNNITTEICNSYILLPITLLGCVFLGAGLGGYFVLQNTFVSECTNEENKELYFGITYMLLGCSYLLNGLSSNQLLKYIGRKNFFIYSGSFELILSLFFIFVPQPSKYHQNQVQVQNESQTQNSLILSQELKQNNVNEDFSKLNILQQFAVMKNKLKQNEMKQLLPLFISTGIVIGFEFGIFHKFISASLPNENEETINLKTANIFLYVGIAQIFSGIFNSISRSLMGILQNSILYSNIFQCMILVAIINVFQTNYKINIILGFLIGLTDNTGQFNSAVIISDIWNEDMAIFGLYLFFQNFGVMLLNLIAIIIEQYSLLYLLIPLIIIQSTTSFAQQKFQRTMTQNSIDAKK